MKSILKLVLTSFLLSLSLSAKEVVQTGTVSIIILKDGKALARNEVLIDGTLKLKTDRDGWIQKKLSVGKHQIEVYGKEDDGLNLGYIKKPFVVKRDKDTQIIAAFTSDLVLDGISIDEPKTALADNNVTNEKKSTGKGTINGVVMINGSTKPIAGARVFVKGTDIDAKTDKNGHFSFTVPSGISLGISVVHSAYSAQTIDEITVENGQTVSKTFGLTPASMELEEYVVLAPKVQGSIASVMAEEKESSSIANILGAEQLSKKGDSSAAGALKRVTGITLVGGKNIYVRGLGERYSNIEMNSLPLPSPDPTKRVVPLDIFPASVIGSLKVQKSASADIPSSFGGGYIDIRTKDSSNIDSVKLSIGVSGSSDTGSSVDGYTGSSTDWFGFDDGYRDIPAGLLAGTDVIVGERVKSVNTRYFTKEQISAFTRAYAEREFSTKKESLPVGYKASLEATKNYDINDDHKISLFGNYGYKQEHDYYEEETFSYNYTLDGKLNPLAKGSGLKRTTKSTYSHGGVFNLGYQYQDFLKVKYTKLYTLKSQKSTRFINGLLGSNDENLSIYYLDWEERSLSADQITGEFEYSLLDYYGELRFGIESATAKLNQPSNLQYTYNTEQGVTHLDINKDAALTKSLNSDDEVFAFYLKNKIYLDLFTDDDYFDVGISASTKERVSQQRTFILSKVPGKSPDDKTLTDSMDDILDQYVRPDIAYDDRQIVVNSLFESADFFDATVEEANVYGETLIKPRDNLELLAGLKFVNITQTIYQYIADRQNGLVISKDPTELTISDIFPNISIKYKMNEDNHLDVAFSKTYILPDLREFTSGSYFHPYDVATVRGNPNLVSTNIYNADLKYSHYISGSENIKAGLFFKYLDKPIEDTAIPSSSLPEYSFDNSDSAILYGIEIEGRKKLDIIKEGLEDYYISGNMSYTESEVTLREDQIDTFTTNNRQLQGLSNLVINTTLGYDTKQRSITLSYNQMGERIRKIGLKDDSGNEPDNIEIPASIMDFVWIENINKKTKVSFKAKNLLDPETVWEKGGLTTKKFKTGRAFSVSASYKF